MTSNVPPHAGDSDFVISPEDAVHIRTLCIAFPHPSVVSELRNIASKYGLSLPRRISKQDVCKFFKKHVGEMPTEFDIAPKGVHECNVQVVFPVGQSILGSYAAVFAALVEPANLCALKMMVPPFMFMKSGQVNFLGMLKTGLYSRTLDYLPALHYAVRSLTDQYYCGLFAQYTISRRLVCPQLAMSMSVWAGVGKMKSASTNNLPAIPFPHTLSRIYMDGDCFGWISSTLQYNSNQEPYESQAALPPKAAASVFASIMLQLCRGLASIHNMGLVHGDMKLENALVDTLHGPVYGIEPGKSEKSMYPYVVLSDFDSVAPALTTSKDVQKNLLIETATLLGYRKDASHDSLRLTYIIFYICYQVMGYLSKRTSDTWYDFTVTSTNLISHGKDFESMVLESINDEQAMNMALTAAQRFLGIRSLTDIIYGSSSDENATEPDQQQRKRLCQTYVADANNVGTRVFMPPEMRDPRRVTREWCVRTKESDIWSLGYAVWLKMTASDIIPVEVILDDPKIFTKLPPGCLLENENCSELYTILFGMLHLDPSMRPTAEQLATDPRLMQLSQEAHTVAKPFIERIEYNDPEIFVSSFRRKLHKL